MRSFSDLVPGSWYITVECACKERIILFSDLTKGTGSLLGVFTITCPLCGRIGSYTAEHYQHTPTVDAATGVARVH
jgi:hypothetical protein